MRSQRRKSRSVPEGGADFQKFSLLAGKCPNLGRDSISYCRKIGEEFSSSVEICPKLFQQGISDSHSLLEFSEKRTWDCPSECLQKLGVCPELCGEVLLGPSKIRDGETTMKIKICGFEGGGGELGAERKIVQSAVFRGKCHDN